MGLSLREQLLQAGLIDAKKAREAGKDNHQQRSAQKTRKGPPPPDAKALAAQQAAAEKAARDLALNQQQQEKREQKARKAQARQLIEQNRVTRVTESDELYNFVDGTRLRRIPVDKSLREKLVSGALVIARLDGRYELISADVAARVAERDPHALAASAQASSNTTSAHDDGSHPVPDDLMW